VSRGEVLRVSYSLQIDSDPRHRSLRETMYRRSWQKQRGQMTPVEQLDNRRFTLNRRVRVYLLALRRWRCTSNGRVRGRIWILAGNLAQRAARTARSLKTTACLVGHTLRTCFAAHRLQLRLVALLPQVLDKRGACGPDVSTAPISELEAQAGVARDG
jgi:hypothetical protein